MVLCAVPAVVAVLGRVFYCVHDAVVLAMEWDHTEKYINSDQFLH